MILEKDPTMVILLNSYWSPGLHLMLCMCQDFWNKILQDFVFIGNLQTFLMPIWNYISSYWKCLQKGNPISHLAWDLASTFLLLKFSADVAGGVVTTTILLDSSCFYCCLSYNLHWGLLAHRLQRLIQWRLRAERIWPFLKFFASKKIVLQVLIRFWSVLSLQNEFEGQQHQQKTVCSYFLHSGDVPFLGIWSQVYLGLE